MSQGIFNTINPSTTSGTQLATILTDFKEAVVSGMSGTSRPTELDPGGGWIDTTDVNNWIYKVWTGTTDVSVFSVNLATGKSSFAGSESTFEISRTTADAVGPIAKFIKQRIATSGQVLVGDVIGEMQFIGRGSDSSNPIVARIRAYASDNMSGTVAGGYFVFETTVQGTTAAAEHMRLIDGKLGVGTIAPTAKVHGEGTTGIKSSLTADSVNPAIVAIEKSRVAGTKATQNADDIGQVDFNTTDSLSAQATSARIKATATQAHTDTARGTKLTVSTTDDGAASVSDKVTVGSEVETIVRLKMNSLQLVGQSVATTATIAQLSATKAIVEFTGSTITSVQGINSAHASKVILLHNLSTVDVTIENENASATAADRIKLPYATAIAIPPQSSLELFYSVTDSRWKLKSGSGSGSGGSGSGGKNYASLLYGGNSINGINAYNDAINLAVTSSGAVVDEIGDVINITAHGLVSGQPVVYSTVGGVIGGLTNGATYFVWVLNSGAFGLALTRAAAIAGTPLVDLTSDGTGSQTFTLLTFPDNATGGTATGLTTALNTSTPLRGTTSQRLSKDASNRQGSGWSYDFTLDRAEYEGAKPVTVTMKYKTSTNYVEGDLKLFVYDKDGNSLAYISNSAGSISKSGTTNAINIQFFPSISNDDYRLVWHIASNNATAWDFDFIDLKVGPEDLVAGAIVTDWLVYPLTIGASITPPTKSGTIAYDKAEWRRVGDSMEIRYSYRHTVAGGAGNGIYKFPLPAGYTIDTNKVAPNNDNLCALGSAGVIDTAAGSLIGLAVYYDTTNVSLTAVNATSITNIIGSGTYGALNNATVSINFNATVPIVGWTATNLISTAEAMMTTARAHYAISASTANASIADNAEEILDFDSKIEDTLSAVTTGAAWRYTAQKTATYLVGCKLEWNGVTNLGVHYLMLYKNGAAYKRLTTNLGGTFYSMESSSVMVPMVKGDYFDVRVYQDDTTGAARSIYTAGGTGFNYISIVEIPDFSVFGTYGAHEIVSSTSLTKTPGGSPRFLAITGSSVVLTPGTWELNAQAQMGNAGSVGYQIALAEWRGAIGSDTGSDVALLESLPGLTVLSAQTAGNGSRVDFTSGIGNNFSLPAQALIIRLTQTQTIHLVPYVSMTTPANGRVTTYITAKRLQ